MVIDRRQLLTLMLAGLCGSGAVRAYDLKRRLFISCRMDAANNASVACFGADGVEVFSTALPARGHDTTLCPGGADIIVFARRPGNWFAVVSDTNGKLKSIIHAPEGRHFYGHGVYSADGRLLYATENKIATGEGVIGIYDATCGYRRQGEFASGGIGPHDIALLPNNKTLLVANGGLRTRPETARETLNPDDMRPNLAVVDVDHGSVSSRVELPAELKRLSMRHLAVRGDGLAAFGCQYEGSTDDVPPLVGTMSQNGAIRWFDTDEDALARMNNYVGSVAFDDTGNYLVATSPPGGTALIWRTADWTLIRAVPMTDVCGVAPAGQGSFLLSSGNAGIGCISVDGSPDFATGTAQHWVWDNHLLVLMPA